MKLRGIIHALVLVLVTGSLVLPTTGCFGDWKGLSRDDYSVFGVTFGGYWAIGIVVGVFVQHAPRLGNYESKSLLPGGGEAIELDVESDGSAIAYVAEHDLTAVLLHDDVNDVVIELAVPGASAGEFTLPAGELAAPWAAFEVDGDRFTTSDVATLNVEISQYPDVGGTLIGSYAGRLQADDGTLHDVAGSFSGPRVQ